MQISDEVLIAYLLGDSTPEQQLSVELQMEIDPSIGERLSQLRMVLGQIDSVRSEHEPPSDLFARTMARIDATNQPMETPPSQENVEAEDRASVEETFLLNNARDSKSALASPLTPNADGRNRRSLWDSTALVVCMTLLSFMLLPTVLRARYEARKTQCAHNLQFLGHGLINLALADPQQRFPEVSAHGPHSFAGIYAVKLKDAGWLESPSQLHCPSLLGCKPMRSEELELNVIPSLSQLQTLDLGHLDVCRNTAGGDYSYNLGVVEDQVLVAPRCEGRANFAILADTPIHFNGSRQYAAHDGVGMNVLYEDGHVSFLRVACLEDSACDDPFFNLFHEREAGVNKQDACLGPSYFGPVGNR
jgi:hypothetical protein